MKPQRNRPCALNRLPHDERAAAAVEFVLIVPVMMVLYVGAVEIANAVMTSRNLSNLSRTLVDLVSRQPTSGQATSTPTPTSAVTAATLTGIVNASQTLIYPQPATDLAMTVSAIDVTNDTSGQCCKALVRWSYSLNGTLRPCGTPLTGASGDSLAPTQLPVELLPVGTTLSQPMSYLIADANYTFKPMIGLTTLPFSVAMARTAYSQPRATGQVVTAALGSAGGYTGQVCY